MSESGEAALSVADPAASSAGVLPYQAVRALVRSGEIAADEPVADIQVQPASLDLRLGAVAWRVRASFLPGAGRTVAERIGDLGLHRIDLANPAVLEKGCVYIVQLQERLALGERIGGFANPKSSIGRIDLFTRLIADRAVDFDAVPPGYAGPLYAEIFPRAFSVVVRNGSRLNQLRLVRGTPGISAAALRHLLDNQPLVDRRLSETEMRTLARGVPLSVDLAGIGGSDLIGFRARKHAPLIDVDVTAAYDPREYWEPIRRGESHGIILDPDDFYILASRESVAVPVDVAAEMVPYDAPTGEFRAHFAGFFDPGFGLREAGGAGTRAVLEVRPYGVPFLIEDGQPVGRLKYERLTDRPDRLYGQGIGSSYQSQGLALSRHFKPWS
jgi:dCTP deaminase